MKKRIASAALALLMLLTLMPPGVLADDTGWTLSDGVLTISSNTEDYVTTEAPWCWEYVTKAVIGKDVTYIGAKAFVGCLELETIEVEAGNAAYYASDGVLFQKSPATLVCYPAAKAGESYTVPNGVASIAEYAFCGCKLNNVEIPDGVGSIGSGAFSFCMGLSGVRLSGGLTEINAFTFSGCENLSSIAIPEGVTSIGESAFESCTKLAIVTIPGSVKSIGAKAFYGCSELKNIDLPEGASVAADAFNMTLVNYVHSHSFGPWQSDADKHWKVCKCGAKSDEGAHSGDANCAQCGREKASTILGSGTAGGLTWSLGTDGVLTIEGSGAMPDYAAGLSEPPWGAQRDKINIVKIGEGPKSIGSDAFSGCFYLHEAELSSTVESVDASAFSGCTAFEKYSVAAENKNFSASDGMFMRGSSIVHCPQGKTSVNIPETTTAIGAGAFKNCSELVQISLPAAVQTIGESAFEGCTKLQSFAIPEGVTKIENSTFTNCASLESVTIPSSVQALGANAFSGCTALKNVSIPEGVTTVPAGAFSGCSALESVMLPASVAAIGDGAFTGCGKLKTIEFQGSDTQWKSLTVGSGNGALSDAEVSCKQNDHVHNYVATVTAPTCTTAGFTTHLCECKKSYTDSEVSALGHNYVGGACQRCGVKDPNFKADDEHEHDFKPTVIAPTCEKEGYTLYSCSCAENYTKDYVSALGHKTALKNKVEPSCITSGSTGDEVCTVCGKTVKAGVSIPATGHATELKNATAAICVTDGYSGDKVCTICGITTEKGAVIPKTGHKFENHTCLACGEKEPVEQPMFSDVGKQDYYYDAVYWALQNGITNGTGGTSFSPDLGCTRAQIVMFLWRAAGCPASSASLRFTDVSADDMFCDAVRWAVETGVTTGTSATTFSPFEPCTRAQIVTLIYRLEREPKPGTICAFSDVPSGAYFENAVVWATEHGITNGTGGGFFTPDKVCTRAEVVTMLYRWQH